MPDAHHDTAARAARLPALGFLLALIALAALALVALRTPPRILTGLPEEPALTHVHALVHDRLRVDSGELRFQSTLLGERGEANVALAIEAERALTEATLRQPSEPRLLAARASLNLAAQRPEPAERLYRQALGAAPSYGEARLGLGVALALRAAAEGDEARTRGLRLRAISQFAAVPERDPGYPAALYDRALLLLRVGRREEAQGWARAYLERDTVSAWAVQLRRELGGLPR
jgi:tetratricopeptide (TPR) repeat protein